MPASATANQADPANLALHRVANLRRRLWAADFRPVAVKNGSKEPLGKNWQIRARQNPPEAVVLMPDMNTLNTGILCDGLRIFDIDIGDPALAQRIRDTTAFELGEAPERYRDNSPHVALVYRAHTGAPGKRVLAGSKGKVVVLGYGQQLLAFGRHPSGAVLKWRGETLNRATLRVVTEAQIDALFALLAPLLGADDAPQPRTGEPGSPDEPASVDLEEIKRALSVVPSDDYETWIAVGMGLYHGTEGSDEALNVWDDWSQKSTKYPGRADIEERWKGFATDRDDIRGIGTVYHYAEEYGWERFPRSEDGGEFKVEGGPDGLGPGPAPSPQAPRPVLDPKALHGLPGAIIRTLAPQTEADPAALLFNTLTFFGNAIGRIPYYLVNQTRHHTNLFTLIVGDTARARKGMAADDILPFFHEADPHWARMRVMSGLSSGEGLTYQVRDAKQGKFNPTTQSYDIIDGADDKRLQVVETEFGSALSAMAREGNRLSAVMRAAWDGKPLQDMVKTTPQRATDHLISVEAQITEAELRDLLAQNSILNGFANRFLYVCAQRAQKLPFGGRLTPSVIQSLGKRIQAALNFARQTGEVTLSDAAKPLWSSLYLGDWDNPMPGLLDAVLVRAPPQVGRLATIYALFDLSNVIELGAPGSRCGCLGLQPPIGGAYFPRPHRKPSGG
jgi:hypothetical protein